MAEDVESIVLIPTAKRTPARKAAAATPSAKKAVRKPSGAPAGATVDAYVASLTG